MAKNTVEQDRAINSDGCNVLVSASAGSGKTFVMIERVKRLILQKNVDIDKILCVTFTVLAAKEMKQKLSKKITEELSLSSGEKAIRLEKQLELLPTANISTMHAFCKSILTEFFYEVGLDPAFNVLDDKTTKILVNRAIDQLFEDLYEQNDADLQLILPYFFTGRSDKALKKQVLNCYYAVISEANPKEILLNGEFYYTPEGLAFICDDLKNEYLKTAKVYFRECKELLQNCEGFKKLEEYVSKIKDLLTAFMGCSGLEQMAEVAKTKLPTKPAVRENTPYDEAFLIERAYFISQKVKNLFEDVRVIKADEQEYAMASMMRPVYNAFINVVLKFFDYFAREKREENGVDYSDLEHFTLKLLQNPLIKEEISSRFEYIFTDEYQDTSGVQEAILSALERNNLFMVGDLKQSIYDFRGCNPEIFANKYEKYQHNKGGIAINLDKNFRSSQGVIKAVNNLFSAIMTQDCGKTDYRKNPMIVGASYPEGEGKTEYLAVKKSQKEKQNISGVYSVISHVKELKKDKCFAEGRAVSNLILKLVGSKYFDADGSEKTLDYGDIALLLRDANVDSDAFTEELIRAGIPVSAPSKDSIGNYHEVALAVDLLKLIDCYNQDIPLASVMKSEIGGFSDKELLEIRQFKPKGFFYDAVYEYRLVHCDELAFKIEAFENYFKKIRVLSEFTSAGEILAQVVREKGMDVHLLSTRMGEIKLARLNKFIEVACASKQTVHEFLIGLDEQLKTLTMNYSSNNAVQIMSIHASKGLEFPVVILAKTTKKFGTKSIEGDFIYDRNFGVAMNYRDTQTMLKYETLFVSYLKYKKQKTMREEEMRLLYVAMTRAKNSLYITGEYQKQENAFPKNAHTENEVYSARKYQDMFACTDFSTKLVDEIEDNFVEREVRQVLVSDADEYLIDKINRSLTFKYPSKGESTLSVKRSVTSTMHYENEEQTAYEHTALYDESNTKIGNAYHQFLELYDFTSDWKTEFNRIIGGHLLDKEYEGLVELHKIRGVMITDLFSSLKDYDLYKEQPFTAYMPAREVEEDYFGHEEVLVQGIIDLLAIKGNEAIIIDYKHSKTVNEEALIKRYKKQIRLYTYAVEKVLGVTVKNAYIVNVNACKIVEIKSIRFIT